MSRKRDEDDAVTQAYLRRIVGYEVTEVNEEYKVNEEGELELLKKTEKTKHVPGDPRAAEFWLTNRCPEKWKLPRFLAPEEEKAEEDGTGVVEIPAVEEGSGSGRAANGSMTEQEGADGS